MEDDADANTTSTQGSIALLSGSGSSGGGNRTESQLSNNGDMRAGGDVRHPRPTKQASKPARSQSPGGARPLVTPPPSACMPKLITPRKAVGPAELSYKVNLSNSPSPSNVNVAFMRVVQRLNSEDLQSSGSRSDHSDKRRREQDAAGTAINEVKPTNQASGELSKPSAIEAQSPAPPSQERLVPPQQTTRLSNMANTAAAAAAAIITTDGSIHFEDENSSDDGEYAMTASALSEAAPPPCASEAKQAALSPPHQLRPSPAAPGPPAALGPVKTPPGEVAQHSVRSPAKKAPKKVFMKVVVGASGIGGGPRQGTTQQQHQHPGTALAHSTMRSVTADQPPLLALSTTTGPTSSKDGIPLKPQTPESPSANPPVNQQHRSPLASRNNRLGCSASAATAATASLEATGVSAATLRMASPTNPNLFASPEEDPVCCPVSEVTMANAVSPGSGVSSSLRGPNRGLQQIGNTAKESLSPSSDRPLLPLTAAGRQEQPADFSLDEPNALVTLSTPHEVGKSLAAPAAAPIVADPSRHAERGMGDEEAHTLRPGSPRLPRETQSGDEGAHRSHSAASSIFKCLPFKVLCGHSAASVAIKSGTDENGRGHVGEASIGSSASRPSARGRHASGLSRLLSIFKRRASRSAQGNSAVKKQQPCQPEGSASLMSTVKALSQTLTPGDAVKTADSCASHPPADVQTGPQRWQSPPAATAIALSANSIQTGRLSPLHNITNSSYGNSISFRMDEEENPKRGDDAAAAAPVEGACESDSVGEKQQRGKRKDDAQRHDRRRRRHRCRGAEAQDETSSSAAGVDDGRGSRCFRGTTDDVNASSSPTPSTSASCAAKHRRRRERRAQQSERANGDPKCCQARPSFPILPLESQSSDEFASSDDRPDHSRRHRSQRARRQRRDGDSRRVSASGTFVSGMGAQQRRYRRALRAFHRSGEGARRDSISHTNSNRDDYDAGDSVNRNRRGYRDSAVPQPPTTTAAILVARRRELCVKSRAMSSVDHFAMSWNTRQVKRHQQEQLLRRSRQANIAQLQKRNAERKARSEEAAVVDAVAAAASRSASRLRMLASPQPSTVKARQTSTSVPSPRQRTLCQLAQHEEVLMRDLLALDDILERRRRRELWAEASPEAAAAAATAEAETTPLHHPSCAAQCRAIATLALNARPLPSHVETATAAAVAASTLASMQRSDEMNSDNNEAEADPRRSNSTRLPGNPTRLDISVLLRRYEKLLEDLATQTAPQPPATLESDNGDTSSDVEAFVRTRLRHDKGGLNHQAASSSSKRKRRSAPTPVLVADRMTDEVALCAAALRAEYYQPQQHQQQEPSKTIERGALPEAYEACANTVPMEGVAASHAQALRPSCAACCPQQLDEYITLGLLSTLHKAGERGGAAAAESEKAVNARQGQTQPAATTTLPQRRIREDLYDAPRRGERRRMAQTNGEKPTGFVGNIAATSLITSVSVPSSAVLSLLHPQSADAAAADRDVGLLSNAGAAPSALAQPPRSSTPTSEVNYGALRTQLMRLESRTRRECVLQEQAAMHALKRLYIVETILVLRAMSETTEMQAQEVPAHGYQQQLQQQCTIASHHSPATPVNDKGGKESGSAVLTDGWVVPSSSAVSSAARGDEKGMPSPASRTINRPKRFSSASRIVRRGSRPPAAEDPPPAQKPSSGSHRTPPVASIDADLSSCPREESTTAVGGRPPLALTEMALSPSAQQEDHRSRSPLSATRSGGGTAGVPAVATVSVSQEPREQAAAALPSLSPPSLEVVAGKAGENEGSPADTRDAIRDGGNGGSPETEARAPHMTTAAQGEDKGTKHDSSPFPSPPAAATDGGDGVGQDKGNGDDVDVAQSCGNSSASSALSFRVEGDNQKGAALLQPEPSADDRGKNPHLAVASGNSIAATPTATAQPSAGESTSPATSVGDGLAMPFSTSSQAAEARPLSIDRGEHIPHRAPHGDVDDLVNNAAGTVMDASRRGVAAGLSSTAEHTSTTPRRFTLPVLPSSSPSSPSALSSPAFDLHIVEEKGGAVVTALSPDGTGVSYEQDEGEERHQEENTAVEDEGTVDAAYKADDVSAKDVEAVTLDAVQAQVAPVKSTASTAIASATAAGTIPQSEQPVSTGAEPRQAPDDPPQQQGKQPLPMSTAVSAPCRRVSFSLPPGVVSGGDGKENEASKASKQTHGEGLEASHDAFGRHSVTPGSSKDAAPAAATVDKDKVAADLLEKLNGLDALLLYNFPAYFTTGTDEDGLPSVVMRHPRRPSPTSSSVQPRWRCSPLASTPSATARSTAGASSPCDAHAIPLRDRLTPPRLPRKSLASQLRRKYGLPQLQHQRSPPIETMASTKARATVSLADTTSITAAVPIGADAMEMAGVNASPSAAAAVSSTHPSLHGVQPKEPTSAPSTGSPHTTVTRASTGMNVSAAPATPLGEAP
ncbi:hypothetical protein Q4I30_004218 [Leishmania utingensis]|uniref:Uncharacterized protein n=1 Tax=Leishmania utingensis TaxID=653362 RepID=A0AAW3AJH2_9TRYP